MSIAILTNLACANGWRSSCHSWLALGTALVALSACDHRLVKIQAPKEIVTVERLAASAAVHFEASLTGPLYTDKSQQHGFRHITARSAQVDMFERALGAIFTDMHVAVDAADVTKDTQILIKVRRQDFQFSTPRQSYTENCEVWLSYELEFFSSKGEPLDSIKLTSYGSASVSGGRSYAYYVRSALNRAIRDAGARLIVELPKNPKIIHIVGTLSKNESGS